MQRLAGILLAGKVAVDGVRKVNRGPAGTLTPTEIRDKLTQRFGNDPFHMQRSENAAVGTTSMSTVATISVEASENTIAIKNTVSTTETDFCAPSSAGVCLENGSPDSDCCAPPGRGSCAEGYAFIAGEEGCYPGSVSSCCNRIPYAECRLSESACSLQDMRETTIVYPDSADALCWNGDSFAFLVRPGRTDKLLYNFPGGGVCFDYGLTTVALCFQSFLEGVYTAGFGVGMLNTDIFDNVLEDYTWVSPFYCGGGAHVANHTAYEFFTPKYQRDYINNDLTLSWVLQNVDQTLQNFVVTGTSAGSLGIVGWVDILLSTFKYTKASVLMDSYYGVFPGQTLSQVLGSFRSCDIPGLRDVKMCDGPDKGIEDQTEYVISKYPKVAFASLGSKEDEVQAAFYGALGLAFFTGDTEITPTDFYRTVNDFMHMYNQYPNYVTYVVDGAHHTFTGYDFWSTTTVAGENSTQTDGKPKLTEWFTQLVNHESPSSHCFGPMMPNGQPGTLYCDERLYPKTLSV